VIDISGTWLGTYWQAGSPVRFEVVFVQSGHHVEGNCLDDINGVGEALIQGDLRGLSIQFSKRYLHPGYLPIRYHGSIADDGNFMQGQWFILTPSQRRSQQETGLWEAHRGEDPLAEKWQLSLQLTLASK
jgi:hypothetical protein